MRNLTTFVLYSKILLISDLYVFILSSFPNVKFSLVLLFSVPSFYAVCVHEYVCVCVMGRSNILSFLFPDVGSIKTTFWLDADHEAQQFKSDEVIGWSIWNLLKGVNSIALRRRKCWPRVSTAIECFLCPKFLFPPYPCTPSPEVDYALLTAPSTYITHR